MFYQQVTNTLPTVVRLLADSWPTVGRLSANSWPTVGQLSADRRPTVGRQLINSRPTGFLGSSSSQLPNFQWRKDNYFLSFLDRNLFTEQIQSMHVKIE